MTNYDDARRLREHAEQHPLLERLRGRHFIPGMHYATQAEAWMEEAATEIERLSALTMIETIVPVPSEIPTDDVRRSARGAAIGAIDRILVEDSAERLTGDDAWTELRKLDENYPNPFLMDFDAVKIRWRMVPR